MPVPDDDERLAARQDALQQEARDVLAELDLAGLFADVGPVLVTGSVVSGLMAWRDLDVMLRGGPELAPRDVLDLLARLVDRPGVVAFAYADERGERSPTGRPEDERYHLPITYRHGTAEWRIDLTIWRHDLHEGVTAWHERLRDTVTPEQRAAILRIKDVWHRRPEYPDTVGSVEIYTAVLEHGVRTPEDFASWLALTTPSEGGEPWPGPAQVGEA
jgi:hypothetical protein